LGSTILKNRVVLAPMATRYAESDGSVSDRLIEHYAARAEGGVGLIVVEATVVHPSGIGWVRQLRIDDESFVPGHERLIKRLSSTGVKVMLQIHHAGRQTTSRLAPGGPVSPSATTCSKVGEQARELTLDEITELVEAFVVAAERALRAGYDGVEVHGAHGYLVHQFLSPHTNRRSDDYGGSAKSRLRFAEEIISGVRKRCGSDLVLGYRVSAEDGVPSGLTVSDSIAAMARLAEQGLDYVSVSTGMAEGSEKPIATADEAPEGWLLEHARAFTAALPIPTITVGGLARPDLAVETIVSNAAPLVALGRGLLAEPRWLLKVQERRYDQMAICVRCRRCTHLMRGCPPEVAQMAIIE
jgi:2,4-dienoyl-CoA reductase-like NADH-dependent reductase (Old Yellow Enzyme family)